MSELSIGQRIGEAFPGHTIITESVPGFDAVRFTIVGVGFIQLSGKVVYHMPEEEANAIVDMEIDIRRDEHERELAKAEGAVETTMAEEPIEDRLRRAWLNGFRDGLERASWGAGRWDHR